MSEPKKNILLIADDDELVIVSLTQILSPEYTVYAVKDGQDAIEKAEKFLPDVILLDIIMPEMDGYAVIDTLKNNEKTQNIPVIFISGLSETEDEKKGLALGASDYISKPFSSDIVKLRVQNQIKIKEQMRLIIEKELTEKSIRAKMEFLANMSHDMFTPMNAIVGMTQIAKREKNTEQTTDCLNEIDIASRHMLGLIDELLDISVPIKMINRNKKNIE